jgi:hypothetical protein
MPLILEVTIHHSHGPSEADENAKHKMEVKINGYTPEGKTSCQHEVEVALIFREMIAAWERGAAMMSFSPRLVPKIQELLAREQGDPVPTTDVSSPHEPDKNTVFPNKEEAVQKVDKSKLH